MAYSIQSDSFVPQLQSLNRVLVAGSFGEAQSKLLSQLKSWGLTTKTAEKPEEVLTLLQTFAPEVLLLQQRDLEMGTATFLKTLRRERPMSYPHVIICSHPFGITQHTAAQALRSGADQVMMQRLDLDVLAGHLQTADRQLVWSQNQAEQLTQVQSRYADLRNLYDSLDTDLNEAQRLQQSLLKDRHIDLGTGSLSFLLRSCGHVGGDFVGSFIANETHVGFFGLDVSGHGVTSALLAARIAGFLTSASSEQNIALAVNNDGSVRPRRLERAVADLNDLVMDELETEHYFTLLLAFANLRTGELTAVQAGHPHPVLQRADGTTEFLGDGGLPVGLIPGAEYEPFTVQMAPGDRFFMVSDGFTEATLPGGRMLGDDGLADLLRDSRGGQASTTLEALMWGLERKAQDQNFDDDLSGVLYEYLGKSKT